MNADRTFWTWPVRALLLAVAVLGCTAEPRLESPTTYGQTVTLRGEVLHRVAEFQFRMETRGGRQVLLDSRDQRLVLPVAAPIAVTGLWTGQLLRVDSYQHIKAPPRRQFRPGY